MRLLPFRRPRAGTDEARSVVSAGDPPGAVRFWTDTAKRRFIRMHAMGDAVEFVAPRTRLWPGQDASVFERHVVSRGALPDTVTCGRGYIEVLSIEEDGILVNEIRTHGDQVVAAPIRMTSPLVAPHSTAQ
jgi:hypothetical protein